MSPTPQLRCVEAVDDIPLLLAQMRQLQLPQLLDRHFPTHPLWKGSLSLGEVVAVWVTFLISQGDHRLAHLEPWIQDHLLTLQACLGKPVRPLDGHDDRLADILDAFAQPDPWQAFEQDLNRHTIRVYDLPCTVCRIDATTASSYAQVLSAQGLIQFGHSKDCDGLPQLKVAACALDPLGMPLTTAVVPGNRADDPLYLPAIEQVRQAFGAGGKTFIGDAKMAALAIRADLARSGDYYLMPLPEVQLSRAERLKLLQPVWDGRQALEAVHRPASREGEDPELVAEGFAVKVKLQAEVGGRKVRWVERRFVVRSRAWAEAQQAGLERRLGQAAEQLQGLGRRKQGKKRLSAEELGQAAEAIVARGRAEGLLRWQVRTTAQARVVRGYGSRPERVVQEEEHVVEVVRDEEAIAGAKRELGWRVYATNHREMGLAAVVWGYRGQYRLEDDWARLKGRPLSLTPMYLQEESRMQGLVLLLSLAIRVLTLLEWQVREGLRAKKETLRGLYPGQPGRQTATPSAELLLGALKGISVVEMEVGGVSVVQVTPLSGLQQRLLQLWGMPADLYSQIGTSQFAIPPPE
jgi:transposase